MGSEWIKRRGRGLSGIFNSPKPSTSLWRPNLSARAERSSTARVGPPYVCFNEERMCKTLTFVLRGHGRPAGKLPPSGPATWLAQTSSLDRALAILGREPEGPRQESFAKHWLVTS